MRQARVFNNIRDVQMEMNVLGIRVRAFGMTLIVVAMAAGVAVAMAGLPITGIIVFIVGFTVAIRIAGAVNAMSDVDATGLRTDLRELTQMSMLWRTTIRPVAVGDDDLLIPYRFKPERTRLGRRRG